MENEIFKRCHVDFNKLVNYGFIKEQDYYIYSTLFMNNSFKVIIKIDLNGNVNSKVIDMDTEEEYLKIHFDNIGTYTAQIKDEYEKILKDIRKSCFNKDYFLLPQSNRITSYIKNKYGDNPEFLWDKYPGFGVFRNKNSEKWYALIANIKAYKIDSNIGETEIINLKIDSEKLDDLLNKNGFYKAYHMNKKDWITILLNDTVGDDEIISLIDKSWNLVNDKNYWLIPANPKYYDIVNAFKSEDEIIWKQSSDIHVKDIIYLYVASPYSCVLFKCEAIMVNIPFEYHDNNLQMKKVVKLKLLKRFNENKITFEKLNNLGIKMIRGPRKINKKIAYEMER